MHDTVAQVFASFSETYEGKVPWMYQDIKGYVTIGIGNKIDPVEQALELSSLGAPLVLKTDPASEADDPTIKAEWETVKGDPALARSGHRGSQAVTNLMITDDGIDHLVAARVVQMESSLNADIAEFASFDRWPADAQLGLLSMAWAMGPWFAKNDKWPSFRAAMAREDWLNAADECRIGEDGGSIVARNAADRGLFRNAAQAVLDGRDPAVLQFDTSLTRPTIQAGTSGDEVAHLQLRLRALGYYAGEPTGEFDGDTDAAVRALQEHDRLTPDGRVGPLTWSSLGT